MRKLLPLLFIILRLAPVQSQCTSANAAFTTPQVSQATFFTFRATAAPVLIIIINEIGDNTQGWGTNVSHTYQASGVYNVLHIVTDSFNTCRDSVMMTVTINVPSTCRTSFNYHADSLQSHLYHSYLHPLLQVVRSILITGP